MLSERTVYGKLVIKANAFDTKIPSTSGLVSKKRYDLERKVLEKKIDDVDKGISNTCGLVKKTDYNTKITEIENKIPSVTALVTTVALNSKSTEIENKIN